MVLERSPVAARMLPVGWTRAPGCWPPPMPTVGWGTCQGAAGRSRSPRPSPAVGCLQLRQKGEGRPQQRQRAGSIWSQLLQGGVTRVLLGLVAACTSMPRFARSRYLTAASAHGCRGGPEAVGRCRVPPLPSCPDGFELFTVSLLRLCRALLGQEHSAPHVLVVTAHSSSTGFSNK